MRKNRFRLPDGIAVAVGLALLLAVGLFAAFWPQSDFSDHERRYLADKPAVPSLMNWKTDKEIESYLSDRVPFRRALVAVDSLSNVLTGRRTQLETWPVNGNYVEKPVEGDAATLDRRLAQMEEVAQKAGAPWHVITPPSHGYLLREENNSLIRSLYEEEGRLYAALESHSQCVPLTDTLAAISSPYYRTDHHWTLAGAYTAYQVYCEALGVTPAALEDFELTSYSPFFGTTYSRSGMPFTEADTLECAEPKTDVTLRIAESGEEHDRLIFPEHAATYDGYAVYMGGNHGFLEILNPSAPPKTLLVFKDSFANCLLPLLSQHFSRVVAVDARYYSGNFSDAVAQTGTADNVLFMYSLDSLLNDTIVSRKLAR